VWILHRAEGPTVLSDAIGRDPPSEEGQLVTQHEDLGVLRLRVRPVDADRIEDAVDKAVVKRDRRGRRASFSPSYLV
jgi:hypothetical protein